MLVKVARKQEVLLRCRNVSISSFTLAEFIGQDVTHSPEISGGNLSGRLLLKLLFDVKCCGISFLYLINQ